MSRLTYEIDAACDAFETRFRAGETPRAEEYLASVSTADANQLLIELLAIEFAYREKTDGRLTAAEVNDRFPNHSALFDQISEEHGPTGQDSNQTIDHNGDFGEYELLDEIARGGMGVVYRARHRDLGRIVALKMILSAHLASPEAVQRFQSEARAAAKLDHPGIVPIYKVGEEAGQHYFTMGLVKGDSLAGRLAKGPLNAREAALIARDIARAVSHAHEQGIVHRDLKPANILLDAEGQPKITDFGLAKHLGNDNELTVSGQILGTPNYMAPEQARGEIVAANPAVDIHALGAHSVLHVKWPTTLSNRQRWHQHCVLFLKSSRHPLVRWLHPSRQTWRRFARSAWRKNRNNVTRLRFM